MKTIILSLFLYLFAVESYCQLPIGNLFDLQKSVTAISKTTLEAADGFGESAFYTEKLPNGNLKVRYHYNKPTTPNPLFITYTYNIEALPSGDFALDMQAAMPPLSLYIDTNAVALSYTGDKIILLNYPPTDSLMPDAKGIFILKKLTEEDSFLTYEVSVTNRKFVNKGIIPINGKIYEAYAHYYNFIQKTYLVRDTPLSEYRDEVEEIYLVGHGLVNQKRQGTMTFFNENKAQVMEQVLISELLNIR
jgi:hypothetical protein